MEALLKGKKDVIDLLESTPFADKYHAPKFIRVKIYDYKFDLSPQVHQAAFRISEILEN